VPIISGLAGLLIALLIGWGYDGINGAVDGASRAIVGSGEIGLLVYGFLNRLLIVTGLHHILNNIAWFVVGDFTARPATCAASSPTTPAPGRS
jgi:PTS system N-acetylglucosamine-specific IIC component